MTSPVEISNKATDVQLVALTLIRGSPDHAWVIVKEQVIAAGETVEGEVYGLNRIVAIRQVLNGENLR